MNLQELTLILSIGISAAFGATLGILRSKIFASKVHNILYFFFYFLSLVLFGFAAYTATCFWAESKIIIIVSIIAAVALVLTTRFLLILKDTYSTNELDPIVNKWTSSADNSEIKLFGGDLSFFGQGANNMDVNAQYTYLRSLGFNHILILCEVPNDNTKRIRYGKILSDMPTAELKFYNPDKADMRVRGRIIKVQGVNKLLVYTKVQSGIYQAIETDMANSNGALYSSIWDLVWHLATPPSSEQIQNFKQLYQGGS
jgi:hypothetical protein